jgi:hypothetical protein
MRETPITVAEVDPFEATSRRAGLDEAELVELVDFLSCNPEAGDLIVGTGGLRKLRWAGRGKGKSGGYRVIYYFFARNFPIYLLAVYRKNQQVDLTSAQKAALSERATRLKSGALSRRKTR